MENKFFNKRKKQDDLKHSEFDMDKKDKSCEIKESDENKQSVITFVLDESGSMIGVKPKTISGFNEYLDTLKEQQVNCKFSLIQFNSENIQSKYNFISIQDVPNMNSNDYRPDNLTPLYDAIGLGIDETQKHLRTSETNGKVIFTIMTDGLENYSKNYTREKIFSYISSKQRKGWKFVFLGANQDTWIEGEKMGIDRRFSADYEYSSPDYAMRYVAQRSAFIESNIRKGKNVRTFFREKDRQNLKKRFD